MSVQTTQSIFDWWANLCFNHLTSKHALQSFRRCSISRENSTRTICLAPFFSEKRGLIKELGLRVDISDHHCIFANNQSSNIKFMYPFCLELHKGRYTSTNLLKYDFWRINTLGFEAEWYIDPNMTGGPKGIHGR